MPRHRAVPKLPIPVASPAPDGTGRRASTRVVATGSKFSEPRVCARNDRCRAVQRRGVTDLSIGPLSPAVGNTGCADTAGMEPARRQARERDTTDLRGGKPVRQGQVTDLPGTIQSPAIPGPGRGDPAGVARPGGEAREGDATSNQHGRRPVIDAGRSGNRSLAELPVTIVSPAIGTPRGCQSTGVPLAGNKCGEPETSPDRHRGEAVRVGAITKIGLIIISPAVGITGSGQPASMIRASRQDGERDRRGEGTGTHAAGERRPRTAGKWRLRAGPGRFHRRATLSACRINGTHHAGRRCIGHGRHGNRATHGKGRHEHHAWGRDHRARGDTHARHWDRGGHQARGSRCDCSVDRGDTKYSSGHRCARHRRVHDQRARHSRGDRRRRCHDAGQTFAAGNVPEPCTVQHHSRSKHHGGEHARGLKPAFPLAHWSAPFFGLRLNGSHLRECEPKSLWVSGRYGDHRLSGQGHAIG